MRQIRLEILQAILLIVAVVVLGGVIEVVWFEYFPAFTQSTPPSAMYFNNLELQIFTYLIPTVALLVVTVALNVYINMVHGFRIDRLENEVRKLKHTDSEKKDALQQ